MYGGDNNFPPYEFLDEAGQPDGFNVQLVQLLAKEAGWSVEIRLRPWRETMLALDRGAVDLAMLAASEDRAVRYDLLRQVWTLRQAVVFPPNREQYPSSLSDLDSETVAVEDRSVIHELLGGLPEVQRPLLLLTHSQREALVAVAEGKATAAAGNALTLRYFTARGNLGPFAEVPVKAVSYHLTTQRGRAAELAPLELALERTMADGRFAELVEDYLAGTPDVGWRQYVGRLVAAGAAALALLLVVAGWNRSLRRQVGERTRALMAARKDLERRVQERTRELEGANQALATDNLRRQATERALRESEDRLESAMRGARLHFWDFYIAQDHVSMSPQLLESLGYDADTFAGNVERWRGMVQPEDLARLREAFSTHIAGGRPFVAEECRLLDAHGVHHWFALDGRVVERSDTGMPLRVSGTVRNIEDSKRLEAQLLQAQRLEALGRLAGGVAHDFNNLLTAILGHVELLQQGMPEDDARQEDLREIAQAGERAATLTRQMLAFARRQPVAAKVVDVNTVIGNVERLLVRLMAEDVTLAISSSDTPALVRIDPGQLEQVLMNLAVNARDAMPAGGQLRVSTDVAEIPGVEDAPTTLGAGRYVRMCVSDTGSGIPGDVLPHIFEPFFTTKEVGRGTGLGLATSYGIIAHAGGAISVRTQPGDGSEFMVWLPALTPDTPVDAARALTRAPAAMAAGDRGTVLIAEDEPQVRALIVSVLQARGYRVLTAASGKDALTVARGHEGPIHLLVSDVVMPGMSGPELAAAIRRERPALPVLLMSGYADRDGRGVPPDVPLLNKPFSVAEFTQSIRSLLDD